MTVPATMIYRLNEERVEQLARHRAFLDHEHRVAAEFFTALILEPKLTCSEWERRNRFQSRLDM